MLTCSRDLRHDYVSFPRQTRAPSLDPATPHRYTLFLEIVTLIAAGVSMTERMPRAPWHIKFDSGHVHAPACGWVARCPGMNLIGRLRTA